VTSINAVQIESSTACNANCTFCPHGDLTRPGGMMADDLFHAIIRQGQALCDAWYTPFLNGEPFAFPKIFEWLDYMEQAGVRIHLYSNCALLDREKIDRLVRYRRIELMHCSFNGATPETYRQVMRGPDFARTQANIQYLLSRATFPVVVGMVVNDATFAEQDLHRQMWGAQAIFSRFSNWSGLRHTGVEVGGGKVPCPRAKHNISILWDGRVNLCCQDHDGRMILGDLNRQSLAEIRQTSRWVRQAHERLDLTDLPLCQACNVNTAAFYQ
jgi:hypothetical protein